VILYSVIPEPVGPALVRAHAGSDLVRADSVLPTVAVSPLKGAEPVKEGRTRLAQALLPLPALGGHHDTGGQVTESSGVLMLVAVLTSRPGAGIPFELKVRIRNGKGRPLPRIREHRDGDGGAVHAPVALAERDPLHPVPARLVVPSGQVLPVKE
jgi:hypothetical protein